MSTNVINELLKTIYDSPEECSCTSSTFSIGEFVQKKRWDENEVLLPPKHTQVSMNIRSGYVEFKFISEKFPDELLTVWAKFRLWRAYKWWLKNAPIDKFSRYDR